MALHPRRRYLRLAGVAVATSLAGCNDRRSRSEPPRTEPTETEPPTTDLVLRAIDEERLDGGNMQIMVFPRALQDWLVQAATGEDVIRKHAEVDPNEQFVPANQLPLTRPEYAHLKPDEDRDTISDQPFRLNVKTGQGSEVTFRAERIEEPPEDRTVIDVDTLSEERRSVAVRLVTDESVTLRPEDEPVEWLRTRVLDASLRYDGHYYDVSKLTPTDGGFVEGVVYFIIDLIRTSTTDAENSVTLRLPSLGSETRQIVESALENRAGDVGRYSTEELPQDVVQFVEETEFLMTYADLYRVSVE